MPPAPARAAKASNLPTIDDGLRGLAVRLFDELRARSFDGVGVTRETYGEGEGQAIDIITAAAQALGLKVARDAAANLVVTLPGRKPKLPAVACGSHLDSVPQGGNFDGAAGVIAGLLALARLKREGTVPLRDMRLYVLRGEESAWYGRCYLGSGALFGQLTPDYFSARHRSTGATLEAAMSAAGADLAPLKARQALMAPDDLACFLELHIEQGPVMVARGWPVALVTGIRGNVRYPQAVCRGEAAHSGAVPRWLRRDAVFAVADLLMRLDEHWRVLLEQGTDLVVTMGILGTNPAEHAISRVPGEARFALEGRSQDRETIEAFKAMVHDEARQIGRRRKVAFEFGPAVEAAPARMDPRVVSLLGDACRARSLAAETLPSGAGHDAAIFANAGVPSGMIFIRNDKGSHNPQEAMDMDDFFLGADVLLTALASAAESERPFGEAAP
jgi:N-carbamoyl-L-amino-acid hydrolase